MEAQTTTTIVDHYRECGFKPVRLSADAKRAIDTEWQKKDVSLDELKRHIERGGNVGLQMGEVSGWLGCVDADCPEAVALAPHFLPETLTAGRNGEDRHYFYKSHGLSYRTFQSDDKELLALKASNNGAGHYVVVEPSKHPQKGRYGWRGGFNPAAIAEVPAPELKKRVELLAASVLVAQRLPERGRHNFALSLVGYMLRNGENPGDALRVCGAAWSYHNAPREAFRDLQGIVRDTAAKLEHGDPVKGGRTLEELMPGMPKKLARFLGWESPDPREGNPHFECTDLGNAERFRHRHGGDVRYCFPFRSWFFFDGRRWRRDDSGEIMRRAKETARAIFKEAANAGDDARAKELGRWAISSQSEPRLKAMVDLAKSEPGIPVMPDALDTDPFLFNVKNGTIDLRTGELREHRRSDLISKIAPVEYDPGARAPTWAAFLESVLPSPALRSFVQSAAGYSLTADTRERALFILHGTGRNGKSTFLEALREALGSEDGYAMKTPAETLMAKPAGGIPNDVARLDGARFVSASETEANRRLAEALVKEITGNDTISARFMRAEWFDFKPTHKVWLATNHKPEIRGTDPAIWDRIRLVPFAVRIPDEAVDKKLPDKLKEELPGILRWAIKGCLEWQRDGLGEPAEVRAATDSYRAEMDVLAAFFEDCCVLHPDAEVGATPLWNAYKKWCSESEEDPGTQTKFGMRLGERGFEADRESRTRRKIWRGIGLFTDKPDPDDGGAGPGDDNSKPPSGGQGPQKAKQVDNAKRFETEFWHKPTRQEGSSVYPEKGFRTVSHSTTVSRNDAEKILEEWLKAAPEWFVSQARICAQRGSPERLIKPLVSSVAYEVHGDARKASEVRPLVEAYLKEE